MHKGNHWLNPRLRSHMHHVKTTSLSKVYLYETQPLQRWGFTSPCTISSIVNTQRRQFTQFTHKCSSLNSLHCFVFLYEKFGFFLTANKPTQDKMNKKESIVHINLLVPCPLSCLNASRWHYLVYNLGKPGLQLGTKLPSGLDATHWIPYHKDLPVPPQHATGGSIADLWNQFKKLEDAL